MELAEFKTRVREAFGDELQHATPANVREFLDRLQQDIWRKQRAEQQIRERRIDVPYEIPSTTGALTWETLVRVFFRQTLDADPEQAVMMLWVFAFDLAYSGIEELNSESLDRLFRDFSG